MGSAVKNFSGLNSRDPNVEYKPSKALSHREDKGTPPMPQFMPWWMDGANPSLKTNRRLEEDRSKGSRMAGEYFNRFHGGGDK